MRRRRKPQLFVRAAQPNWRGVAFVGVLAVFVVLALAGVELPGGRYAFAVAFVLAIVASTIVSAVRKEEIVTVYERDGRAVLSYDRGGKSSQLMLDELARVSREQPGEAPTLVLDGLRGDRVALPLGVWLAESRLLELVSDAAERVGAAGDIGSPVPVSAPMWILPTRVGTTLATMLLIFVIVNLQSGEGISAEPVTPDRVQKTLGRTASPFEGTPACDVYVVPLDRPTERLASELRAALARRVAVSTCLTASMQLSASLVDDGRKQLDSFATIDHISPTYRAVWGNAPSTVLGITELDVFGPGSDNRFSYGGRGSFFRGEGFGVISTARMGSGSSRFRRLETMAMRYVGLLYYGLPLNDDPTSALYSTVDGHVDLDRMRPEFSNPPPSPGELAAARGQFLASRAAGG
jgi:hypothetical protein